MTGRREGSRAAAGSTVRRPGGVTRNRRLRAGTGAVGALMMLAVSVCGVVPASSSAISAGAASTNTASTNTASGGGRTRLADNSQCTTQKDGATLASSQSATPWETTYANTQSSGLTGAGVKVAIIDTGITGSGSFDYGTMTGQDFTDSGGVYRADVDGHGTLVASILAAQPSSDNGMVGIAPGVKLMIYREAGCNVKAGSDETTLAKAINAAVAAGAQIINISQDGYNANAALKAAVINAYKNNVLIVASAGNYGDSQASENNTDYGINPVMYPASYAPYLLAVGAANQDGSVADFSETGSYIGVVAPGVDVGGLFPDGKVWLDNGTSFAAPYVAGVAALLLQKHPDLTPAALMKVLESTASGGGKWNKSEGWGLVDATAALSADPGNLQVGLFGAGPNADGPSTSRPAKHGTSMQPIVAVAESQTVIDQRKDAYLAVGAAVLVVLVAIAGTVITRDARRRARRQ